MLWSVIRLNGFPQLLHNWVDIEWQTLMRTILQKYQEPGSEALAMCLCLALYSRCSHCLSQLLMRSPLLWNPTYDRIMCCHAIAILRGVGVLPCRLSRRCNLTYSLLVSTKNLQYFQTFILVKTHIKCELLWSVIRCNRLSQLLQNWVDSDFQTLMCTNLQNH